MMTLRETFKQDFGIDLPISGAGTLINPIVIDGAETSEQAAKVAETVLLLYHRGRARAQASEIIWRIDGSVPAQTTLQRYKLVRVLIDSEQILTEDASYYFAAPEVKQRGWPRIVAASDMVRSLFFPQKLEWLEHTRRYDYEAEGPGLGYSHHYAASGIFCTIYVYTKGLTDTDLPAAIERQVQQALSDVERYKGNVSHVQSRGIPPIFSNATRGAFFVSGANRDQNLVAVDHRRGAFVKARATWSGDALATKRHEFIIQTFARMGSTLTDPKVGAAVTQSLGQLS